MSSEMNNLNDTDEFAIDIDNISKCYRIYDRPSDRLKHMFFHRFGRSYGKDFWALRDISFRVKKGETIGVIGKNGSGKSTLLQIIAGTLSPTGGLAKVRGRVSALLELGSGFNPEYTGRENVYLNGATLGISRISMDEKIKSIIEFAELGEFIDQSVKTYSSGMAMRIAFAVAVHVDPEILIIDEALSVGDARFQQKCLRKIEEIRNKSSILLVSHDLTAVRTFCNRAIWIQDGQVKMSGDPNEICRHYLSESFFVPVQIPLPQTNRTVSKIPSLPEVPASCQSRGIGGVKIIACGFIDKSGQPDPTPIPGTDVRYAIRVVSEVTITNNFIVGLEIRNRLGEAVLSLNNLWADDSISPQCPPPGGMATFLFSFKLPELNTGTFTVSPAVSLGVQLNHEVLHWVEDVTLFEVPRHLSQLPGQLILKKYSFRTI